MIKKILLVMPLWWSAGLFAQTNIYVSPSGNNADNGSIEKPFRTIEKAIVKARKIQGKVFINLFEGVYYLNKPIVFTAEDSRKQDEPLVIRKFKDQKVIISGSIALKLNWKEYKNGIWQAPVADDIIFDELFVNGKLQTMARYPNIDSTAKYYRGTADDVLSKERILHWQSPEGGYIHALHSSLWGDMHYLIKGKKTNGELLLEGGWQNNRQSAMHEKYRFVENIFEELDTVNEWYFDKGKKILFYYPPKGVNLHDAIIETPQLVSLIELKSTKDHPIQNIHFEGIIFTHTLRSFMQNKEPLLRSDWTIFRGGAVFFNGTENCAVKNCVLTNIGGNAIFFNNYNRKNEVSGCLFDDIGASAICFVGDPNAARSPSFEYYQFVPLDKMDKQPGPKTNNYPANCKVYNNLIHDIGIIEKQSAGVQLSMCANITVSHNTIYDVPRAGINVSEGTWGGHLIECNDVFNTVKESGDHGSFNSWGRDRYWHFDKKIMDSIVEKNYSLALADVIHPIIIRNNRMRCDHGWDIDLDDGSSNYIIQNNLCLNGGIKLREGVNRVVENNIIVNNTFHPHVWFKNSNDVFKHNIVFSEYLPVNIAVWGKEVDYNIFIDSASLKLAWQHGTDKHSVCGNLQFVNAATGDFTLKDNSIAFSVGFKNFDMNNFGVVSVSLKKLAKKVVIPQIHYSENKNRPNEIIDFYGAAVKMLDSPGEQSATGLYAIKGAIIVSVKKNSAASKFLQINDVILKINSKPINSLNELSAVEKLADNKNMKITIFRNQKEQEIRIGLNQ
ncbi:PDZ domain (also known as DHR or GLGF) [mine drainage metagenome]|uniref:PDZ domain (Also known as DHR or GLGF) n=1 Tax=mine drainage metagenome TaxID=410659 RepID=A0A1J5SHG2_9ZZZZ